MHFDDATWPEMCVKNDWNWLGINLSALRSFTLNQEKFFCGYMEILPWESHAWTITFCTNKKRFKFHHKNEDGLKWVVKFIQIYFFMSRAILLLPYNELTGH